MVRDIKTAVGCPDGIAKTDVFSLEQQLSEETIFQLVRGTVILRANEGQEKRRRCRKPITTSRICRLCGPALIMNPREEHEAGVEAPERNLEAMAMTTSGSEMVRQRTE